MRDVLKTVLAGLGFGALCAGAVGGALAWLQRDAEADRDARIATLETTLAAVRQKDTLTGDEACAIAEAHLLGRPTARALSVTCDAPTFEPYGPRAGRLTGAIRGTDLSNALFGGGFATPLCLARTAGGWEVVGDDHTFPGCAIDVPLDAPNADAVTASAIGGEASRRLSVALATLDAVRSALAADGAPDTCGPLALGEGSVTTLADATLAGRPPVGTARHFGYGLHGCVPAADAPAHPAVCSLREAPTHVLLVDAIAEDPPVSTGPDTFTGGTFRATLRLVDIGAARVLCERPVTFALPAEVVTLKSRTVVTEYDQGLRRALCAETAALSPDVRLDPWWGCDG